jgi:hypothetical protein
LNTEIGLYDQFHLPITPVPLEDASKSIGAKRMRGAARLPIRCTVEEKNLAADERGSTPIETEN